MALGCKHRCVRAIYGSKKDVVNRRCYTDDLLHNDVESRVATRLEEFVKRRKGGEELATDEETEYMLDAGPFLYLHYTCDDEREEQRGVYKQYLAKVERRFDEANAKHEIACSACNKGCVLRLNDGDYVCDTCQNIEAGPSTYTKADFETNPPPRAPRQQLYRPINHFNEMLVYFQGQELSEIPSDVVRYIRTATAKHYPMEHVTHVHVKKLLRLKRLNKYYRNIPTILQQALGVDPPRFTHEQIGVLQNTFVETQAVFQEMNSDRINFLSITYLLYKFCEMMGWVGYLQLIPLLKSPEKLAEHDATWSQICDKTGWYFIKTKVAPKCLST